MTLKRTSPSVLTNTNQEPFTQTMQGASVVSVPTHSDVGLQPQVVATKADNKIYDLFFISMAETSSALHLLKDKIWMTYDAKEQSLYSKTTDI